MTARQESEVAHGLLTAAQSLQESALQVVWLHPRWLQNNCVIAIWQSLIAAVKMQQRDGSVVVQGGY
jgi:hypothetical protein